MKESTTGMDAVGGDEGVHGRYGCYGRVKEYTEYMNAAKRGRRE